MKPLPTDPMVLNARIIDAMCSDLSDIGSGKSSSFERTDAIREMLRRERIRKGDEG